MTRSTTPYLQRRGDTFFFRIAVPADLRPYIGGREITRTLMTSTRHVAIPRALLLGSKALHLFSRLRSMPKKNKNELDIDFGMELSLDEFGLPKITFSDIKPGEELAVVELARQIHPALQASSPTTPNSRKTQNTTMLLSALIEEFLLKQDDRSIDEMMKKHRLVLPLFLRVLGDKPVGDIRQADIDNFFDIVNRLPKYWQYDLEKGMAITDIVKLPDRERMSEWTFKGTYKASVAKLLKWGRSKYHDQGFPTALSIDEVEYLGDRKKGEQQKQRAFTPDELKRLFEGPEMQAFAADPEQAHKFWLPHIGLFTGARVNEICQINPQTDIRQDAAGIWYFLITEETETDAAVRKSVKTSTSREVPIHQTLLDLGLLAYVEKIKDSGAKLLFPQWEPKGGRASRNAGEEFIEFLKDIRLHGVKNEKGRAIHGYHAFRHTILTYGKAEGRKLNLRCITGHKERSDNEVADGYEDDTIIQPLVVKKQLLDSLDYGLQFHVPVAQSRSR